MILYLYFWPRLFVIKSFGSWIPQLPWTRILLWTTYTRKPWLRSTDAKIIHLRHSFRSCSATSVHSLLAAGTWKQIARKDGTTKKSGLWNSPGCNGRFTSLRVSDWKSPNTSSDQKWFLGFSPIYMRAVFRNRTNKGKKPWSNLDASVWNCVQGRDSNHCQHEFIKMLSLKANEQWTSENCSASFTKNLKLLDAKCNLMQFPRFPTSWQASIQALKQRQKSWFLEAMPGIDVHDMRSIKGAREYLNTRPQGNAICIGQKVIEHLSLPKTLDIKDIWIWHRLQLLELGWVGQIILSSKDRMALSSPMTCSFLRQLHKLPSVPSALPGVHLQRNLPWTASTCLPKWKRSRQNRQTSTSMFKTPEKSEHIEHIISYKTYGGAQLLFDKDANLLVTLSISKQNAAM